MSAGSGFLAWSRVAAAWALVRMVKGEDAAAGAGCEAGGFEDGFEFAGADDGIDFGDGFS